MSLTVQQLNISLNGQQNARYSFKLQAQEYVGLVGINGAGKSTLIKALTDQIKITDGDAIIEQCCLTKEPLRYKSFLGYMPDQFPLINESVTQFLHLASMSKQLSQFDTEQWLAHFNLLHLKNRSVKNLSLGERQRLSLAQALLAQPKCLVLDEPLNGLDPAQQDLFWQQLKQRSENASLLIASHHLNDILNHCSRLLILEQHQLVADIEFAQNQYLFIASHPIETEETSLSCVGHNLFGFSTESQLNNFQAQFKDQELIVGDLFHALPMLFRYQANGEWKW